MDENKLFIPQGMKAKREWFQGFGQRELIRTTYATIGLLILALLVYVISGQTLYIIGILIFGETGIVMMLTRTPESNISAFDQVVYGIEYFRSQQKYYYKQMKEL
jgi:hypothetical protein